MSLSETVEVGATVTAESAAARHLRPAGGGRRWLAWAVVALTLAAVLGAGVSRRPVVNPGGWPLLARFWRAAASPESSPSFLAETARAALTTLSYAVLGTALSLVIGVLGGLLLSRRILSRRIRVDRAGAVVRLTRLALVVPRGVHEAVWALLLLTILGRDPIVAVLAIGLPFGAITAKVFADLLDESAARQHRTLRAAGAGRLQALVYGTLPASGPDLVSYGFYRFECAVRSAVVLGMVGTGGLGFQLGQSFQGLAYGEMWTSLYALLALGAAAEYWSAWVRRGGPARRRPTLLVAAILGVVSWWHLRPSVAVLWSGRTFERLARWVGESTPPQLPRGGWRELAAATVATVHVSFLAIVGASVLAVPLALLAGRAAASGRARRRFAPTAMVARFVALLARSVPPTVWALLALFVFFPGVVPGAVALGLYTSGVLVRLFAEALEHADARPSATVAAAGAGRLASFAYGTLPDVAPRWAAYSMYRWEVAARDAAVVGVVGVAGLGRLLGEQTAGFAFPRMATTVTALVVVTVLIDATSRLVRGWIR